MEDRIQHERYNSTTRFSLIVTITAPAVDVDIYTEITNRIVVPVEVAGH